MSPSSAPVSASTAPRPSGRGAAGSEPGSDTLASLVAARRAELGLSLRGLGERSGVHYSHLSKVESGQDGLGLNGLAGLSVGLELPLSELLQASGVKANHGLPSFAGYLDVALPNLSGDTRRDLEATFASLTGLDPDEVPSGQAQPLPVADRPAVGGRP